MKQKQNTKIKKRNIYSKKMYFLGAAVLSEKKMPKNLKVFHYTTEGNLEEILHYQKLQTLAVFARANQELGGEDVSIELPKLIKKYE